MSHPVLHESLHRTRQSLEGERIVRLIIQDGTIHGTTRKLRALVKRDAYDSQSYGRVYAWTDKEGWKIVSELPIQDLPIHALSYVSDPGRWENKMADSLDIMIGLGARILS